jgi:predicted Zn-ribbon and HTH transcriptional regulator
VGLRGPAPCTDPQVLHERLLRRRELQRAYYARNREAILARRAPHALRWSREFNERHRDELREKGREAYAANREREIARTARYKERQREFVAGIKGTTCSDCGGTFESALLHFHHRNPETKSFTIGTGTWSRESLLAEIEKCDVLCVGCHSKRHWTVRKTKAAK